MFLSLFTCSGCSQLLDGEACFKTAIALLRNPNASGVFFVVLLVGDDAGDGLVYVWVTDQLHQIAIGFYLIAQGRNRLGFAVAIYRLIDNRFQAERIQFGVTQAPRFVIGFGVGPDAL